MNGNAIQRLPLSINHGLANGINTQLSQIYAGKYALNGRKIFVKYIFQRKRLKFSITQ